MLSVKTSNIAIITIKNRCIIHNISKSEAINLLENSHRGYIYTVSFVLIYIT